MITAPYNFVPLNKEIFYPSWSKDVSHDVPFADGESGEIDITITAKSPIFIRNHSEDKQAPSSEFCHFTNTNGGKEFYIPGSSLKGMIRSVLEIISFSKIKLDEQKLNESLSIRDMTNQNKLVGGAKKCGFLIKENDNYFIEDCGNILTISHYDLQQICPNIKKFESAKDKYEKFGIQQIKFKSYSKMMDVRGKQIPKKMAQIDSTSSNIGVLVFTGDIGNKKHEFVFKTNGTKFSLEKQIFTNFSNVYLKNNNSIDGQFWKQKSQDSKLKIPIFYKQENGKITAIGLTQLFKLSYNKTLLDAAKQSCDDTKLDFSETIFGTIKHDFSLKGRVQFSHLKCTTERYEKEVEQVLGSPNPSYYPNYIRQTDINKNNVNRYITLMDQDAEISGWKRYPLQSSIQSYPLPTNDKGKVKNDISTKFKPLNLDSIFVGKLRFHNLKKAEIGALLSALTFHGQSDTHMHNIGMAKALGYGKIDIKLTPKNLQFSQEDYLKEFENEITKDISNWRASSQLNELFAMANIHTKSQESLTYQLLENPKFKYGRDKNDFTGAKKAKEYLLPHSSFQQTQSKTVNKVQSSKINIQSDSTTKYEEKKKEEKIVQKQIHNEQNGISKTKIKKALLASWQRVYNIYYHQNQIKEFLEGKFLTTPDEQAAVYLKLIDDKSFITLIETIARFNEDMLNQEELKNLYDEIINLQ